MNVGKESGLDLNVQQPQQVKTDLDIYKLLIQMGIHPEKWLLLQEEKEGV